MSRRFVVDYPLAGDRKEQKEKKKQERKKVNRCVKCASSGRYVNLLSSVVGVNQSKPSFVRVCAGSNTLGCFLCAEGIGAIVIVGGQSEDGMTRALRVLWR